MTLPTRHADRQRGQTLVLGALTLLVLALVVMVTINITVSTRQKIKIQNHADAQAYSMAVQQARALNYFAYTNRAIASSYVGMANLHAYMSEAAMLVDIKQAAAGIMGMIAAQETAQCFCCAMVCVPCRPQHCYHAFEASTNAGFLSIEYLTGEQGDRIQRLDGPATQVMQALDLHIDALRLSQNALRANVVTMLGTASVGSLRDENMQGAASVAQDHAALLLAQNTAEWNDLFYSGDDVKRRIMAETVNASRHPFAWNRHGTPLVQGALFPPNFLVTQIKSSPWMGPNGTWGITQVPDTGMLSGGRTGFTNGDFPLQAAGIVVTSQDAPASTVTGLTLNSFDYGVLGGQWRHGAGAMPVPMLGPAGPGELLSGSGWRHRADLGLDFFNSPHNGSAHDRDLQMERFTEFNIDPNPPYNQPAVYAAASTDSRVTEHGIRGPWEVSASGDGTLNVDLLGGTNTGTITLTNNARALAVSKALVYYHRIGDWSDYPNLFNPYWRAKLHPLTLTEVGTVITPLDTDSATVAGSLGGMGGDVAASANIAP